MNKLQQLKMLTISIMKEYSTKTTKILIYKMIWNDNKVPFAYDTHHS